MTVEIHVAGLEEEKDLRDVRERLNELGAIQIGDLSLTRIRLSYDESEIDATTVQEAIERVGAQVITMRPTEDQR